jgi:hypothetical protein
VQSRKYSSSQREGLERWLLLLSIITKAKAKKASNQSAAMAKTQSRSSKKEKKAKEGRRINE